MKTNEQMTALWGTVTRGAMALALVGSVAACGGGEGCVEAPVQRFTPAQVAALTPAQVRGLRDVEIVSLGTDLARLSADALAVLTDTVRNDNPLCTPHVSQLAAITPAQVQQLQPQQVRFLGAGSSGVARLRGLAVPTFDALVANPAQVRALTAAEYADLPSSYFTRIGELFAELNDAVLMSLHETYRATPTNTQSAIGAITARQVSLMRAGQLALLGTADGALPRYRFLQRDAYLQAMQKADFVARIPAAEVVLLNNQQIADLGAQLALLPDATLQSLRVTYAASPTNPTSQVGSLTAAQVRALSAAQLLLVADIQNHLGLAALSESAFAALQPAQTALLQTVHFTTVSAQQLAGLSEAALAALPAVTRVALTPAQKNLLTPAQLASLA